MMPGMKRAAGSDPPLAAGECVRLVAVLLLGALVAASSGCKSAPAKEGPGDETPSFAAATRMGLVQEAGTLRVGVPRNMLPFAGRAPRGAPRGFMVDLGRFIAAELGVRARFVTGSPAEIVRFADDGRVDMSFALEPITGAWIKEHVTSNPYFVAHQRLLVRSHSSIGGVSQLAGKKVCQAVNPVSEVPIEDLRAGAGPVVDASVGRCISLLRRGRVAAVTASDVKLMPASSPGSGLAIVGDDLSTEGYGMVGAPKGKGWAGYLDGRLSSFKSQGEWMASYDRWIADRVPDPVSEAPHMTSEGAAALFPEAIP